MNINNDWFATSKDYELSKQIQELNDKWKYKDQKLKEKHKKQLDEVNWFQDFRESICGRIFEVYQWFFFLFFNNNNNKKKQKTKIIDDLNYKILNARINNDNNNNNNNNSNYSNDDKDTENEMQEVGLKFTFFFVDFFCFRWFSYTFLLVQHHVRWFGQNYARLCSYCYCFYCFFFTQKKNDIFSSKI